MADKKIVLITGGNTGIGYEAVKAILQSDKPYLVLMGSRSLDKAHAAIEKLKKEVPNTKSTVEPVQVDITSDESIEKVFEEVKKKYGRVDALVNNAGGAFEWDMNEGKLSLRECWTKTFDVNVSGTQIMTNVFASLLLKSPDPRLLFITSGLSSLQRTSDQFYPIATPPPAGWPKDLQHDPMIYRTSKTALNMLMLNWAWRFANDGVKVWSVSPGFLATGLGNAQEWLKKAGAGHPSIGGNFIKDVVEGKRDADVGKVVFNDGTIQPF